MIMVVMVDIIVVTGVIVVGKKLADFCWEFFLESKIVCFLREVGLVLSLETENKRLLCG